MQDWYTSASGGWAVDALAAFLLLKSSGRPKLKARFSLALSSRSIEPLLGMNEDPRHETVLGVDSSPRNLTFAGLIAMVVQEQGYKDRSSLHPQRKVQESVNMLLTLFVMLPCRAMVQHEELVVLFVLYAS